MRPDVTLRIARPTDELERLVRMYVDGLGLAELGRFIDHDGYDGVMLGVPGMPYHLEFTRRHGHRAGGSPSDEHLLVFYLEAADAWQDACGRMLAAGFVAVASANPYWDAHGRTFADADGYRVVLQNARWPR